MWAHGVDFNHGTGHGVGINVHEAPPRVATTPCPKLEVGHVFSIEPGVYRADFGGVRIENLCTILPAPGAPGFMDVVPLTSSALDERLFDHALLTDAERAHIAGQGWDSDSEIGMLPLFVRQGRWWSRRWRLKNCDRRSERPQRRASAPIRSAKRTNSTPSVCRSPSAAWQCSRPAGAWQPTARSPQQTTCSSFASTK
jgi:hypothetical protein